MNKDFISTLFTLKLKFLNTLWNSSKNKKNVILKTIKCISAFYSLSLTVQIPVRHIIFLYVSCYSLS